jgi:hypothetical protein
MSKYIKQVFLLLFCLMVVSCESENEFREITNPPITPVDTGSSNTIQPELDVLLVLDNSCSMMSDWDYITYGIAQIPEELNFYNFDWKLALVSMDPGDITFLELDPTTPSPGWGMITLISDFKLVAGQAEAAFDSAISQKNRNYNWFRPGVTTLVIFISDEREQSVIEPQDFPNLWYDPIVIASIVGPMSVQEGETPCAEVAVDFYVVSQIIINICTNERWSVVEPLLH